MIKENIIMRLYYLIATGGFDPPTFGLWARHATSAPCRFVTTSKNKDWNT